MDLDGENIVFPFVHFAVLKCLCAPASYPVNIDTRGVGGKVETLFRITATATDLRSSISDNAMTPPQIAAALVVTKTHVAGHTGNAEVT